MGVLLDLRVSPLKAVDLFCDNKATIQIAANPIFTLDSQVTNIFTKALNSLI